MTRSQFHGLSNSDFQMGFQCQSGYASVCDISVGEEKEVAKQCGERVGRSQNGRNEQVTCKTLEKGTNTMEGGLDRVRL